MAYFPWRSLGGSPGASAGKMPWKVHNSLRFTCLLSTRERISAMKTTHLNLNTFLKQVGIAKQIRQIYFPPYYFILLINYFLRVYKAYTVRYKFSYDIRRHYFCRLTSFQRNGGSFHYVRTRGRVLSPPTFRLFSNTWKLIWNCFQDIPIGR